MALRKDGQALHKTMVLELVAANPAINSCPESG